MSFFRHTHRYQPISVQHRNTPGMLINTARETVVLWHCNCSAVLSTVLAGEWTLTEVRGEPDPSLDLDPDADPAPFAAEAERLAPSS